MKLRLAWRWADMSSLNRRGSFLLPSRAEMKAELLTNHFESQKCTFWLPDLRISCSVIFILENLGRA